MTQEDETSGYNLYSMMMMMMMTEDKNKTKVLRVCVVFDFLNLEKNLWQITS